MGFVSFAPLVPLQMNLLLMFDISLEIFDKLQKNSLDLNLVKFLN
jgi:hypothetical protein